MVEKIGVIFSESYKDIPVLRAILTTFPVDSQVHIYDINGIGEQLSEICLRRGLRPVMYKRLQRKTLGGGVSHQKTYQKIIAEASKILVIGNLKGWFVTLERFLCIAEKDFVRYDRHGVIVRYPWLVEQKEENLVDKARKSLHINKDYLVRRKGERFRLFKKRNIEGKKKLKLIGEFKKESEAVARGKKLATKRKRVDVSNKKNIKKISDDAQVR